MSEVVVLVLVYVWFDKLLIWIWVWNIWFTGLRKAAECFGWDLPSTAHLAILHAVLLTCHAKLYLLNLLQALLTNLILCLTKHPWMLPCAILGNDYCFWSNRAWGRFCIESCLRNDYIELVVLTVFISWFNLRRGLSLFQGALWRCMYLLELWYLLLPLVRLKHLANVLIK